MPAVTVVLTPAIEPDESNQILVDAVPVTLFVLGDRTKPFAMPLKLLYASEPSEYIPVHKDGKPVYLSDRNPVISLDTPGIYVVIKTTTLSVIGAAIYESDAPPEE